MKINSTLHVLSSVMLLLFTVMVKAEVNYRLLDAATAGDLSAVKKELQSGADINLQSYSGYTALMRASYYGYADIVAYLLKEGASLGVKNLKGEAALYQSVLNDQHQIVKLLLKGGADANTKNTSGESVLIQALKIQSEEIAKSLVDAGVNVTSNDGDIAMIWAVVNTKVDLVRLLAAKGANINAKDGNDSVFMLARRRGNAGREMTVLLVELGVDIEGEEGSKAIYYAVTGEHDDVLLAMINRNININQILHDGNTPLTLAIRKNKLDSFKVLINSADPDAEDRHGRTALMIALFIKDRGQMIDGLVAKSKRLNHINKRNETALRFAVKNYPTHILDRLVKAGADVNIGNPLQAAASYGYTEKVKYLINSGADLEGKSAESSLTSAAYNGHMDIIRLILENGKEKQFIATGAAQTAARRGHIDIVELLLKYGVDSNQGEANGGIIYAAASSGSMEMGALLLSYGAKVNTTDKFNISPLMQAVDSGDVWSGRRVEDNYRKKNSTRKQTEKQMHGHIAMVSANPGWRGRNKEYSETVKILLEAGADPDKQDSVYGLSALMCAVIKGYIDTTKVLLSFGSNKDLVDKDGKTALDYAKEFNRKEMMKLLQ